MVLLFYRGSVVNEARQSLVYREIVLKYGALSKAESDKQRRKYELNKGKSKKGDKAVT